MTSQKYEGYIEWSSPSNIASIKYWGKKENQIPMNPSLSFTLKNSKTITGIKYKKTTKTKPLIKLIHDNKPNSKFQERIENYITTLKPILPTISQYDLEINTRNTFPHSTGIASSASAFSALALCLYNITKGIINKENLHEVSNIARMGSGSASRSLFSTASIWGKTNLIENSCNTHAIDYSHNVHPIFKSMQNTILIINEDEKKVSSSKGHKIMENNPFAKERYKQANANLEAILPAIKKGDFNKYSEILENEALTLHALMMTSKPGYILMKPNTLKAIDLINIFKIQTNLPITYTLDAGPNIHVQYPKINAQQIKSFIELQLKPLCSSNKIIYDEVGNGPEKIK